MPLILLSIKTIKELCSNLAGNIPTSKKLDRYELDLKGVSPFIFTTALKIKRNNNRNDFRKLKKRKFRENLSD